MKIKFIEIIIFVALLSSQLLVGCSPKDNEKEELENLANMMIGSFDSEEQSLADTNFYNIHLEMVRIWEEREDAIYLYVEQAAAWALEKPYRQRVYKITKNEDGVIESGVYTINDPLRFAGDYEVKTPLKGLTADSITVREGCAIILKKEGEVYVGSTVEKECTSNLRGATYATSEVKIEKTVLTSWDRGFDENDEQVWGAVTGPYIFKKKNISEN